MQMSMFTLVAAACMVCALADTAKLRTQGSDIVFDFPGAANTAKFVRPKRETSGECTADVFELQNRLDELKDTVNKLDMNVNAKIDSTSSTFTNMTAILLKNAIDSTTALLSVPVGRIDNLVDSQNTLKKTLTDLVEDATKTQDDKLSKALEDLNATLTRNAKDLQADLKLIDQKTDQTKTDLSKEIEDLKKQTWLHKYTRWGHTDCPTGHTKWYDGVIYGPHQGHSGTGDLECIKNENGLHGGQSLGSSSYDILYPMAIDHNGGTSVTRNAVLPCAECVAKQYCFVARGIGSCPTGFEAKYKGYMFGSHYTHPASTHRICIDEKPNKSYGGYQDGWMYSAKVERGTGAIPSGFTLKCSLCCST